MSAGNPEAAAPRPLVVALCFALLCLIWSSTWIVIKGGLDDLPPFTAAAARFLIAWLVFRLVAARLAEREGGVAPGRRLVLAMGLLNFGASYAIVYWSETLLPSGLVSLLWATFPMMMALSGHLFIPGERLRGMQWLGFGVGFAGVAVLFATDLGALREGAAGAALVLLCSPLVSTVGTTLVKLEGARVSSLQLNRDGMLLGAIVLGLLALLFERDAAIHVTPAAAVGILYLALVGTVVAFGLYFWLMRFAAASKLSLIAYITPPLALGLGALDGEPLGRGTLMGAVLILVGVLLATRRRRAGGEPGDSEPAAGEPAASEHAAGKPRG